MQRIGYLRSSFHIQYSSHKVQQVWIYRSHIHLVPLSHVSAPSSKPARRQFKGSGDSDDEFDRSDDEDYLSVEDALQLVRDSNIDTAASGEIESAVGKKIHGCVVGYWMESS